ncbi:uncharacterized membrane protein YoaK (UPF0700 family) [Leuconostoc rapi]|nr:uncharacterized membrane protein YoaK (UPF0700 family) [Leuconostoc rapi]
MVTIIYWIVMLTLIVTGVITGYRSYRYANLKLHWYTYLLYVAIFLCWITVRPQLNVNFVLNLSSVLAVLYLITTMQRQS